MGHKQGYRTMPWFDMEGVLVKAPEIHPQVAIISMIKVEDDEILDALSEFSGWVVLLDGFEIANIDALVRKINRLGVKNQRILVLSDLTQDQCFSELILRLEDATCLLWQREQSPSEATDGMNTVFSNLSNDLGERICFSNRQIEALLSSSLVSDNLGARLLVRSALGWPEVVLSGGSFRNYVERFVSGLGEIPAPQFIENELELVDEILSLDVSIGCESGKLCLGGLCFSLTTTEPFVLAELSDSHSDTILQWPIELTPSPARIECATDLRFAVRGVSVWNIGTGLEDALDLTELETGEYTLRFRHKSMRVLRPNLTLEGKGRSLGDGIMLTSSHESTLLIKVN